MFRLLGLHPGEDIGVPAAAGLAALPLPEARSLLAEQARASLLTEHVSGRFAYHDLLRAYAEAVACDREALGLFRSSGNRYNEADTLTHLGDTHRAAGDREAARRAWREALAILTDLRHPDVAQVRARLDGAI